MAETVEFELVSPAELLLSEKVEMVVVPGGEGDFGVLPGHTDMISTVRAGQIDIHDGGKVTKSIFVEGGFAEVTSERCTVLAVSATPVADLDANAAAQRLEAATEAYKAAEGSDDEPKAKGELDIAEAMVVATKSN
ncbi:MAG: ATP synthase F1 subunit epsilon [Alphaproteobacteria bacterium]|nr:ATP synthase F1 subunit epsilon [Rhodospirillales bacterium]MCW9044959.1 ATP synthase F1 subunit epsilon [Alphaproteobacteria bacterium]